MKVRNGFVSNSSSSSFILVTSKENHETALGGLAPDEQTFIKAIKSKQFSLFGKDAVSIRHYKSDDYSDLSEVPLPPTLLPDGVEDDGDWESWEARERIWNKYLDLVKQNEKETFTHWESH